MSDLPAAKRILEAIEDLSDQMLEYDHEPAVQKLVEEIRDRVSEAKLALL